MQFPLVSRIVGPVQPRTGLAVVLLLLIVGVGGYYLQNERLTWEAVAPTPWKTTDHWLAFLQVPEPSRAVEEQLRTIAPKGAIVFIGPATDGPLIQTYYAFSFLAPKQPISALLCRDGGVPPITFGPMPTVQPIEAVVLYRMASPPGLTDATPFGPSMLFVKTGGEIEWTSLCPS